MFCNTQATFSASPNNARSECALTVNPSNPQHFVGASKKFANLQTYDFSLASYASFDGGVSWAEAPFALDAGWGGISDPTLAWDRAGNVYLAGLPFEPGENGDTIGIAMYRSTDGGRSWSAPNVIHRSTGDDKQWAAGDTNPSSPHHGNVYVVWDDLKAGVCAFARSTDNGASWTGTTGHAAGSSIGSGSFAPQVAVSAAGTVYVIWAGASSIMFTKSTDGGSSFSPPIAAVSGITPLTSPPLSSPSGFTELPGGSFRVLTLPSLAVGAGNTLVVSWADYREGRSRIYYGWSQTAGSTWGNAPSGQPLLAGGLSTAADQHDFHPQLAALPNGQLGCAFYEFGPKWTGGPLLIEVCLARSGNNGVSFSSRELVSDRAWDPRIDAPWSHGDSRTTFIGDYFGLTGSNSGFNVFWTDTRTGIQEIFYGGELRPGPWFGTQFTDTLAPHQTVDFFTFGWPACWDVVWTPMCDSVGSGPQISWNVQVERAPYFVTYHVVITNLTGAPVSVEGRYAILAI